MNLYYKISPILMIIGFVVLAVGVFLSMSHRTASFALAGLGLTLYIIGRIGMHFAPKKTTQIETIADEDTETKEIE